MKKRGMPAVHGSEVNVTPLIDVVMCLIIFFMVVTKIGIKTGADEKILIPEAILGKKIEDMGNTIVLNVKPPLGGEAATAGSDFPMITTLVDGTPKELRIQEGTGNNAQYPLRIVLKAFVAAHKQDASKVIIRAGADLQYRFLQQVLTETANAGVRTIDFTTKQVTQTTATE